MQSSNWLDTLTNCVNAADDFVWGAARVCPILSGVVRRAAVERRPYHRLKKGVITD